MDEVLSIAIQKTGRLSEKSLDLIRDAGIRFLSDSRVLKERALNYPVEFFFVRDDDIPMYVTNGVADIGFVGKNEVEERRQDLEVIRDLSFGACRLSIAVPNDFEYKSLKSLEGKRIATSYPNILSDYLDKNRVKAELVYVAGSVEITVQAGIADAICDLVSTGTTLRMNGLVEAEAIYYSSAVIVSRKGFLEEKSEKAKILNGLLERLDALSAARGKKYVIFNLPSDKVDMAAKIVGALKSPTVTPLVDKSWVSVQSVVAEDDFWRVFENLRKIGAEGILVMNIEKMTE